MHKSTASRSAKARTHVRTHTDGQVEDIIPLAVQMVGGGSLNIVVSE